MVVTRATEHALCSMLGQGVRGCGRQTPTWHVSQIPIILPSGIQMTRTHPPTGARTAIERSSTRHEQATASDSVPFG